MEYLDGMKYLSDKSFLNTPGYIFNGDSAESSELLSSFIRADDEFINHPSGEHESEFGFSELGLLLYLLSLPNPSIVVPRFLAHERCNTLLEFDQALLVLVKNGHVSFSRSPEKPQNIIWTIKAFPKA